MSISDLIAQRDQLDAAIAMERARARNEALATIAALLTEHSLTSADVFPAKRKTVKVAPKYRDPATGTTWTGRGRAPTWFDAARISEFTI